MGSGSGQGLAETIKDAIPHRAAKYLVVRYDAAVRKYYYLFEGRRVYIVGRQNYMRKRSVLWHTEQLYFAHYRPRAGDTVVDFGAGYGEEAVYLFNRSPEVRYIGVEIQPSVFECLALTFNGLGSNRYIASPCVVSQKPFEQLYLTPHYLESGLTDQGHVPLPTVTWQEFARRYDIDKIDLLKMNIEGGELQLLQGMGDLRNVRRVIVSCHDFLGKPECRTKQAVTELLRQQGFQIQAFNFGIPFADDWLFASRHS